VRHVLAHGPRALPTTAQLKPKHTTLDVSLTTSLVVATRQALCDFSRKFPLANLGAPTPYCIRGTITKSSRMCLYNFSLVVEPEDLSFETVLSSQQFPCYRSSIENCCPSEVLLPVEGVRDRHNLVATLGIILSLSHDATDYCKPP
jgi:hypothetical protein